MNSNEEKNHIPQGEIELTLNIDLILWHTQLIVLIVRAVKY